MPSFCSRHTSIGPPHPHLFHHSIPTSLCSPPPPGHWCDVPELWRDLYALASCLQVSDGPCTSHAQMRTACQAPSLQQVTVLSTMYKAQSRHPPPGGVRGSRVGGVPVPQRRPGAPHACIGHGCHDGRTRHTGAGAGHGSRRARGTSGPGGVRVGAHAMAHVLLLCVAISIAVPGLILLQRCGGRGCRRGWAATCQAATRGWRCNCGCGCDSGCGCCSCCGERIGSWEWRA